MFLSSAAAISVIGALSAFGVAEATYSNSNSNSGYSNPSYSNSNSGSSSKSCESGHFWYDRLSCCLKNGGESNTPPSGSSCPDNFYWHTTEKCCVPKSSDTSKQIPSSCASGSTWNSVSWCCKSNSTPSSTSCGSNAFWWSPLNVCISIGGGKETPPSGYSCPSSWSWLSSKSCCKPDQPNTPTTTPSCGNNWSWHPGKQCCVPGTGTGTPTPSNAPGTPSRKRHTAVHKRTSFCPTDYESCPILDVSGRSTDSECIDTRTQLKSCGGCTSIGKGQDCSKIANAKVTTCQASRCVIEKCKTGYEISGDSCVAVSHHAAL